MRLAAYDLTRLLSPVAAALTATAERVIRRYRVLADGTRRLVAALPLIVQKQEISVA